MCLYVCVLISALSQSWSRSADTDGAGDLDAFRKAAEDAGFNLEEVCMFALVS